MPTSHGVDIETATSRSNMTRASLKTTCCISSSQSWNHKAGFRNPVPSDNEGYLHQEPYEVKVSSTVWNWSWGRRLPFRP
ncbi:hypothetical protein APLC1_1752 [Limnospira platensis C1]|uniref:Uncharacterized protein n=2 Tax=Limnospira TaxID=2596745 RepID=A0A9P1KIS7_9CYAN|nr:hypothetical protein APLC1_1752 [Arthrospira platensis C1]CDM96978.1 hypothetical protein ARTHRO_41387 [Limnospira indica PCC 8005]